MKTIYIADDGTHFDDFWECEFHEWRMKHPYLRDVHVYDKTGQEITDMFSNDDAYDYGTKVVVTSEDGVKDFIEYAEHMGYCDFEDITEVGEWIWSIEDQKFRKVRD